MGFISLSISLMFQGSLESEYVHPRDSPLLRPGSWAFVPFIDYGLRVVGSR